MTVDAFLEAVAHGDTERALVALEGQGLLAADEVPGARAVLNAAALTYVAGFVAALGQLLYFFALSRQ